MILSAKSSLILGENKAGICREGHNIRPMSSSRHLTIMSLEQAKANYHKVVTKDLTYFPILQIVSGKGP